MAIRSRKTLSLRGAPLLYLFYETASLDRQRELCEQVFEFPVIENQFHPPHEYHGLIKYDAGGIILSLNLSMERRFQKESSDGLVTVMSIRDSEEIFARLRQRGWAPPVSENVFTDTYGHHYIWRNAASGAGLVGNQGSPAIQELRLTVADLPASLAFYGEVLGLDLLSYSDNSARFATGTVDLVLVAEDAASDGRPVRFDTYLIVFYTRDIVEMREALTRCGLIFRGRKVGYSDIGGTARFVDPSGHMFCLYQPSLECLAWGSGPKVRAIIDHSTAVLARA